jgi:peptide/nickel transport system permease protein
LSSYLTFRIFKGLLVVVLISLVTFGIMRLIPGDPVQLLLGEGSIPITQDQIAAIRAKWGLDRPLHQQYLVWAGNLLRGDFGDVAHAHRRAGAADDLRGHPRHRPAQLLRVLLAITVAIPLGIAAAVRRNSWVDYTANVFSALGIATPNFWLALMLIVVFSLQLPVGSPRSGSAAGRGTSCRCW